MDRSDFMVGDFTPEGFFQLSEPRFDVVGERVHSAYDTPNALLNSRLAFYYYHK